MATPIQIAVAKADMFITNYGVYILAFLVGCISAFITAGRRH